MVIKCATWCRNLFAETSLNDIVIPPAIDEVDNFYSSELVKAEEIRKKTIENLEGRDIDKRRLSEELFLQQQRSFAQKAQLRRMTLI